MESTKNIPTIIDDETPTFSFKLDRTIHHPSIFLGIDTYEIADPNMINGFISTRMGIHYPKDGKFKNCPYTTELKMMTDYQTNQIDELKTRVIYRLAKHRWGRVQAVGSLSLSLFHRPTRHSLCDGKYIDFDMVNCQPALINQVCLMNGITNKEYLNYCSDPKKMRMYVAEKHLLKPFVSGSGIVSPYEQAKKLFLCLSFGGSYETWMKTYGVTTTPIPQVVAIESELTHVIDRVWKENTEMIADITASDPNWAKNHTTKKRRTVMALFAQSLEKMVQERAILGLVRDCGLNLSAIVPCQDGFMLTCDEIARCDIDIELLLKGVRADVMKSLGFDIPWEIKPFDQQIDGGIPCVVRVNDSSARTFEDIRSEFEKTHCKIINSNSYVKQDIDGDVIMTRQMISGAYEHIHYTSIVKGEPKKISFIRTWLEDEKIRRKRTIGIYPHDLKCPDDVYNSWSPFTMEKVDEYVEKPDALEIVKRHISILCDHDAYTELYFSKWIACMIQFPSIKLTMPCFISKEGSGKGSLLQLFSAMFGHQKILNTQNPSETVWGSFNGLMLNTYLVCLDEISKKEMAGSEGKIKGLITEPTITINGKGKERFSIDSYHKFISFANPDTYGNEPMTTTDGDRRKWFVQCSDELVGNKAYFDVFYKMLGDRDSVKTVFEYYRNMDGARDVTGIMSMPTTAYTKNLKEMSIPPIKRFMRDYVMEHPEVDKITTSELFLALDAWKTETKTLYECSMQSFACRLSNLKISGMAKSSNMGTTKTSGWVFDKNTIRHSLGIDTQATMMTFNCPYQMARP